MAGVALLKQGHGLQQRVDALERLDPPGEEKVGLVGRHAHARFGRDRIDGVKARQIDAGRNHANFVGRGAVQLDQLRLLGGRGGD